MALTTFYLVTDKNLEAFLNSLLTAKAPERFNHKFLKDLGFASSNDRLFVGLLKALGFIDESGTPRQRYFDFLDQSQWKQVLASAVSEAYEDMFRLNTKAYKLSAEEVKNKLKTLTQGKKSENVISLMAKTFKGLCDLADWSPKKSEPISTIDVQPAEDVTTAHHEPEQKRHPKLKIDPTLHYNIQIVLPESRDQAVFDAIFRSIREHLF